MHKRRELRTWGNWRPSLIAVTFYPLAVLGFERFSLNVAVLLFLPDKFIQLTSCFLPVPEIWGKSDQQGKRSLVDLFSWQAAQSICILFCRAQKHVFHFSLLGGTCACLPSPSGGSWHLFVSLHMASAGDKSLLKWRLCVYGYEKEFVEHQIILLKNNEKKNNPEPDWLHILTWFLRAGGKLEMFPLSSFFQSVSALEHH